MGRGFKETSFLNIDQDKYQDNLARIQALSRALKEKIFFDSEEITLEKFAREWPAKFEGRFDNEFDQELADKMALVHKHIITEGN